jgi:hypothetical protein
MQRHEDIGQTTSVFTDDQPGVQVDDSNFPLIIMRVGNFIGPKEMADFLEENARVFARKQPFAYLVIVRKRGKMEWSVLNQWGKWSKANEQAMRELCKGVAFVFPGDAFRMLLSAILAVSPGRVPHKVFSSQLDAYAWTAAQLAPTGYRTPVIQPTLWP